MVITELESIFSRLRAILVRHAGSLSVADDSPSSYSLEGKVGPATLKAWGGKLKRPAIPVASVQVGKAGVSYHIMGLYGNAAAFDGMSKGLKARMHGKTCFNFRSMDEKLFAELEPLTDRAIACFRKAGYVTG